MRRSAAFLLASIVVSAFAKTAVAALCVASPPPYSHMRVIASCPAGDLAGRVRVMTYCPSDSPPEPQPVPGSLVSVAVGGCSGFGVCLAAARPSAIYQAVSNINGYAIFHLAAFGTTAGCAQASADGVIMGAISLASVDQDGDGDVDEADRQLLLTKLWSTTDATADFDDSGVVDHADEQILVDHMNHICEAPTPVRHKTWGALKGIYR